MTTIRSGPKIPALDRIQKFLKILGPGFITGASDDDPSGIATYSQTGAQFGYAQLWTAVFTLPFQSVVQEMCGRIGMVTGKGLAGIIRKYYGRRLLLLAVLLLLAANTINIGADLGAMAAAARLALHVPFVALLLIMAGVTLSLEVFTSYKTYARVLKYFTFALFAYIITAFAVHQDWKSIALASFIPSISLSREYLMNIVAVLGTTISPYMFFWQAGEEVEEEVAAGRLRQMGAGVPRVRSKDIRNMRLDTAVGVVFSNLVMWFIIVTTASTLHLNHVLNVNTAEQAAQALRPIAGDFAFLLFVFGIIGTGLLTVPILAGSASYAISEALGWKEGLYQKFTQAHGFYGVIAVATLVGLLANFTPIQPFEMLYYSAVLNGLCAPVLIVLILLIANNPAIMGKHTNSVSANAAGWIIAGVMGVSAVGLLLAL